MLSINCLESSQQSNCEKLNLEDLVFSDRIENNTLANDPFGFFSFPSSLKRTIKQIGSEKQWVVDSVFKRQGVIDSGSTYWFRTFKFSCSELEFRKSFKGENWSIEYAFINDSGIQLRGGLSVGMEKRKFRETFELENIFGDIVLVESEDKLSHLIILFENNLVKTIQIGHNDLY